MKEPTDPLKELIDTLARFCFGMTAPEAAQQGICINCKEPALEKCTTEASKEEYRTSALCEPCFDKITKGEENGKV